MLDTETGYRRMFSLAAFYNLSLGLIFLVFFSRLMVLFDMPVPPPELVVFPQMAILLAMVFGIGYLIVSRDLYGQTGIIIIGIIGKITVFVLFSYHFIFSHIHFVPFLIGVGDLIFALLFLRFLVSFQGRRAGKAL